MPVIPPEDEAILHPRNLDEVYAHKEVEQVQVKKVKDEDAASTISAGDSGFAM